MPRSPEKYEPNPKEIKKAEEIMTPEEKKLSETREPLENLSEEELLQKIEELKSKIDLLYKRINPLTLLLESEGDSSRDPKSQLQKDINRIVEELDGLRSLVEPLNAELEKYLSVCERKTGKNGYDILGLVNKRIKEKEGKAEK